MLLMIKECLKMLSQNIGRGIVDCIVEDLQGEAYGESKWMLNQLLKTSTKILIYMINELSYE